MTARPSTAQDSPNACLRDFLLKFFEDGPYLAALRYRICSQAIKIPLQAVVRGGPMQVPPSLPQHEDLHEIVRAQINDQLFVQTLVDQSPWEHHKRAAEFVTLLCADLEQLETRVSAAAFNSRKLGGDPSMAQVRMEPSADLAAALSKAIAVQRAGDAGRAAIGVTVPSSSTCLVVLLADTAAIRAEEQRNVNAARAASYTHRFVLLVDGTGVGVYHAWGSGAADRAGSGGAGGGSSSARGGSCILTNNRNGSDPNTGDSNGGNVNGDANGALGNGTTTGAGGAAGGYTLQDWLQNRSPGKMSYHKATDFVRTFQEFCGCLNWDDTANRLYQQLFGIDLRAVAEASGQALPGRIRSWVRILEVPYVTAARIRANSKLFM